MLKKTVVCFIVAQATALMCIAWIYVGEGYALSLVSVIGCGVGLATIAGLEYGLDNVLKLPMFNDVVRRIMLGLLLIFIGVVILVACKYLEQASHVISLICALSFVWAGSCTMFSRP